MAVGSIVDYLKSQGQDSSYAARSKLAAQNGIQNYKGTAQQNTQLLGILRSGAGNGGGQASGPSGTGTVGAAPGAPAAVQAGSVQNAQSGPGVSGSASGSASGSSSQQRTYQRSDRVNQLYDRAQSAANDMPGDYTPSEWVQNYRDKLADIEADRPDPFESQYADYISSVLDGILNEEDFSYTGEDMMNDDLYKMYSDQYKRNARLAMQDTMGNAMAATGGYGSSYAQAVGQQAYDAQLAGLNDIAMELADRAYDRYLNDRSNRYNQMNTLVNLDSMDYDRYRDTVGDWQLDRNYYAGRYDSEYAKDYGEYRDQVTDAENERNYWLNFYDAERDNDFGEYQQGVSEDQWSQEFAHQQAMDQAELAIAQAAEARAQAEWERAMAQAASGGGSSGGSSRKSSSKKSSSSKKTSSNKKTDSTETDRQYVMAYSPDTTLRPMELTLADRLGIDYTKEEEEDAWNEWMAEKIINAGKSGGSR